MKIVKFCLLPLLVLVSLPFIVGLFFPDSWEVEVSTEIAATPAEIHPWVDELARWPEWMTPLPDAPPFEFEFDGAERGVGAVAISTSPNSTVRWEITASDPEKGVWFDELLEGTVTAKGAILLEAQGGETRVTWTDRGSLGNSPIHRLFHPLMESTLESGFRHNLAGLKAHVEAADSE